MTLTFTMEAGHCGAFRQRRHVSLCTKKIPAPRRNKATKWMIRVALGLSTTAVASIAPARSMLTVQKAAAIVRPLL